MRDEVGARWRKSTFSDVGSNCVEVAPTADAVLVRHSKHPASGTITFPRPAWAAFLREARNPHAPANGVATITTLGPDTLVTSLTTDVDLRFTEPEWTAFLAGVAAGEFDFTTDPQPTLS